jgi:hypothetical protein
MVARPKETTRVEDVREQGAERSICIQEGGGDRKMGKSVYEKLRIFNCSPYIIRMIQVTEGEMI